MRLENILKKIEDSEEDIIKDMMAMIRIPSIGPMNGGEGEGARADYLVSLLKGFDSVERIEVQDAFDKTMTRPNILAKKNGKKKGTVWVIAHMDTVLPGDLDEWKYPPFEPHLENGRIYGLGTEDNGQAVIASLYASKYFDSKELNGRSIGIAFVADEETTSEMGIGYLVRNGYFSSDDVILVPDWGSPGGSMIDVAEKHLLWVKATIEGKQTHGSTPEKGINAYRVSTMFLADVLTKLEEKYGEKDPLFRPPVSTFEPTKRPATVGNVNTIPGYDEFWMDCRIIPKYDPNEIMDFIKTIAEEHSKKTKAKITVEPEQLTFSGQPSSIETEEFQLFKESINSVTGVDVQVAGVGGGTCANFFRLKGLNAYVWESEGGTLHQPNEYVVVKNIITDAKVYATLFDKLCVN